MSEATGIDLFFSTGNLKEIDGREGTTAGGTNLRLDLGCARRARVPVATGIDIFEFGGEAAEERRRGTVPVLSPTEEGH